MKRAILIVLGLIVIVLIGAKLWYSGALKAAGGSEQTVTIADATTTDVIAKSLQEKKLIKSGLAFKIHVRLNGIAKNFKQGRYKVAGDKPATEIARKLTEGPGAGDQFTLKEGITQREMAGLLGKQGIVDEGEFRGLKAKDFDRYDFLKDVPEGASLEGFLFPETYNVPPKVPDTRGVAEVLLTQFGQVLTPELRSKISQSGRNIFEIVTVASMVEEEVRSDEDRRLVAGIMYRRLKEDVRLDIDATTRYAVNKKFGDSLTDKDLDSSSPYNTRRVKGLPPGPICNPGLSALKAAIEPKESEFLFYLSAKDGKTIFSKTLEEHEANVQKHLR